MANANYQKADRQIKRTDSMFVYLQLYPWKTSRWLFSFLARNGLIGQSRALGLVAAVHKHYNGTQIGRVDGTESKQRKTRGEKKI